MKKFYFTAIAVCGFAFSNAQVIDLENPSAQVMDISNTGVAVGNLNGAVHFIFDTVNGGRVIGDTSDIGVAGNENISADGTKISASVLDANGIENGGIYNVQSGEWKFLEGLGITIDGGQSSVWGMSADGNHIAGMAWSTGGNAHAIKWDNDNPIPTDLGSIYENKSSRANAINADGSVVVGWQATNNGYWKGAMWKNGVGTILKDNNGVELGEAANVSANGKTIIGQTADGKGYIWREGEGTEIYDDPNPDFITVMTKISDDGNTALGFSFSPPDMYSAEGLIYTKAKGFQKLNNYVADLGYDNLGISFIIPTGISPDGQYIGGMGINWDVQNTAGFMIKLPAPLATSDVVKDNATTIFPNPVKDIAKFKSTEKIESVEIFNLVGQKVISAKVTDNQINLSSLAKGVYVVTTKSKAGVSTTKLIKD